MRRPAISYASAAPSASSAKSWTTSFITGGAAGVDGPAVALGPGDAPLRDRGAVVSRGRAAWHAAGPAADSRRRRLQAHRRLCALTRRRVPLELEAPQGLRSRRLHRAG